MVRAALVWVGLLRRRKSGAALVVRGPRVGMGQLRRRKAGRASVVRGPRVGMGQLRRRKSGSGVGGARTAGRDGPVALAQVWRSAVPISTFLVGRSFGSMFLIWMAAWGPPGFAYTVCGKN